MAARPQTPAEGRPLWLLCRGGRPVLASRLAARDEPLYYAREGDREWTPLDPANLSVLTGSATIERFKPKRGST